MNSDTINSLYANPSLHSMVTCSNCNNDDMKESEIRTIRGGKPGCAACSLKCTACGDYVYNDSISIVDPPNEIVCAECVTNNYDA